MAFTQDTNQSFHLWKLHSLSGEVNLNGHYREQEQIGLKFSEYQKSSNLSGGVLLRTNSSILHENFLVMDIDAGYMPETSHEKYIITPNQAEVRTAKKIGINGTFLRQKIVTFNLLWNYDESYSTRENITDIKTLSSHWGGSLNYLNKVIPLTFIFSNRKMEQLEIQDKRKYTIDEMSFGTQMTKSFTRHDKNELRYSHDENVNVNQNLLRLANTTDHINFTSFVNLGSKKTYNLNTFISDFNQHGNVNMRQIQANENISILLSRQLKLLGNYSFHNNRQDLSSSNQQNSNTSLQHQLFESLQTRINFDYNSTNHSVYKEFNTRSGIEFTYTKKIPSGKLLLSYKYSRYHQDYSSTPVELNIANEQYKLSDNKITLLKISDIDLTSVIVKDATGTIIYANGLDYILIVRKNFIEIRRVPGGLIADDSNIFVDYKAIQPGSYRYDSYSQVFSSSINLLKNIISINYRFSNQDYSNLEISDKVTLNYFTQNLVGFRLDFGFLNTGVEFENYKSSILPYRLMRYYANIQKKYNEKLIIMLNGNMQDYVMLDEPEAKYQRYIDVTGKVTYALFGQTSVNMDMMYRKQNGRGIDLNLFTAKTEIAFKFNLLFVAVGLELYRQDYISEIINFKGTYVKILRKF